MKQILQSLKTGATEVGRGRVPKWLTAELAKGRKREEFALK